jgi:hypothetical protein
MHSLAIIVASYFPIVQKLMGYLSKNMSISGYATKTVCENVNRVIKQRRFEKTIIIKIKKKNVLDVEKK